METFSALLAICVGNSPVLVEFPAQRPVTQNFDILFDLHPNKRLSKQWRGWWFETPSCPFWRHLNEIWRHQVFARLVIKYVLLRSHESTFTTIKSVTGVVRVHIWYYHYISDKGLKSNISWWRHQMETFSALLAIYSPHKGQWRGTFMFSLICARINCWANNREAGDLRRYRAHFDVTVMLWGLRDWVETDYRYCNGTSSWYQFDDIAVETITSSLDLISLKCDLSGSVLSVSDQVD